MKRFLRKVMWGIGGIALLVVLIATAEDQDAQVYSNRGPVTPNWASITAWPSLDVQDVLAQPDPNRRVTAIVLDDSGSMGSDIDDAKAAVVGALDAMADADRVAVLALNAGVVLGATSVADARAVLPGALAPIEASGSTPLSGALVRAQQVLETEAAAARGFGTFRLIVTTDGQADDAGALDKVVTALAANTPIQLTTIGIGLRGQHVLRRDDLGSFVDVANVAALQEALQAAVAENTDFTAITNFSGD